MARISVTLSRSSLLSAVIVAVLVGLTARSTSADTPLDGQWSASALTEKWVIGDWGAACGPKPGTGGESAGVASVAESGGELTIRGAGRTYSTTQCWDRSRGLRRVSHSSSPRRWQTTCKTPTGEARQATVTTTVTATDDAITFYEAGQYQFVPKPGQNCTASVGRYRNLHRQKSTLPSASASAAPLKKPEASSGASVKSPVNRCARPGPAARFEVRPARKLMRPGEQFAFRAVVADAAGCTLRTAPNWEVLQGGEHVQLVSPGVVRVHEGAPEAEVELAATAAGKSARVVVEIASKARYDALLARGAFNEAGEVNKAASVRVASKSLGAGSVVAEDRAGGRKAIFVALVGGLALLLGVVGLVVVRQSRRAARRAQERALVEAEAQARAAAVSAPEPAPPAAPSRKICPLCGTQYPATSRFCGSDGALLVPLN